MTGIELTATPIAGVQVISRRRIVDQRGYLERQYDSGDLEEALNGSQILQVNRTYTRLAGTVRGLHLQLPPNAEAKIVSCLKGRIFDVAVDLRGYSSTFLRWFGCELSDSNQRSLLIPPGCAHGIQTLEADCEVLYLHTSLFAPESEAGLSPLNSDIDVKWPMPITFLSERDLNEDSDPVLFERIIW